jgi:protein TonB
MSLNPSLKVVPASALVISVLAHGLLLGVMVDQLSNPVWTKSGNPSAHPAIQLIVRSDPEPKSQIVDISRRADSPSRKPHVTQNPVQKNSQQSRVLTLAKAENKVAANGQGVRRPNQKQMTRSRQQTTVNPLKGHLSPAQRPLTKSLKLRPIRKLPAPRPLPMQNAMVKALPPVKKPSLQNKGADVKSQQAQGATLSGMQLGTLKASPINVIKPRYPSTSRRRGEEGRVSIWVSLDAAGQVQQLRVIQSSHHHLLDEAALAAARATRFEPEKINGKAVPSHSELHYRFKLNSL